MISKHFCRLQTDGAASLQMLPGPGIMENGTVSSKRTFAKIHNHGKGKNRNRRATLRIYANQTVCLSAGAFSVIVKLQTSRNLFPALVSSKVRAQETPKAETKHGTVPPPRPSSASQRLPRSAQHKHPSLPLVCLPKYDCTFYCHCSVM